MKERRKDVVMAESIQSAKNIRTIRKIINLKAANIQKANHT